MDEEKWQFCWRLLLSSNYTLIRNCKRKSRSNLIQSPFTVNYTRPFLIHFAERLLSDCWWSEITSAACHYSCSHSPPSLTHVDTSYKSKCDLINYETRTPRFRLHYEWIYILGPFLPYTDKLKNLGCITYIESIFPARSLLGDGLLSRWGATAFLWYVPVHCSLKCQTHLCFATEKEDSKPRKTHRAQRCYSLTLSLVTSCFGQCWTCW